MDRMFIRKKSLFAIAVVVLACLTLLVAGPALAQESDLAIAEEAGLQKGVVGLGVGMVPDYEGSDDYEAAPLILARYNWTNGMFISLLGNSVRLNLVPDKDLHAGLIVRYRKERDDVDSDRVDRLEKVDASTEVGAFGSIKIENWSFMLTAAQDVSDGHDGYLVDLSGAYTQPFNQDTQLILFASTSYANDDYMEAYFQVDAADAARSGLREFEADSGLKDVAFGLALQYSMAEPWGILGLARYSRLLGDAEDSPVVDVEGDANQWLLGALVNYRF